MSRVVILELCCGESTPSKLFWNLNKKISVLAVLFGWDVNTALYCSRETFFGEYF